jgi:hypothetical protein
LIQAKDVPLHQDLQILNIKKPPDAAIGRPPPIDPLQSGNSLFEFVQIGSGH